jgi:hypothetical protein
LRDRSEAIQTGLQGAPDRFAALAMTMWMQAFSRLKAFWMPNELGEIR